MHGLLHGVVILLGIVTFAGALLLPHGESAGDVLLPPLLDGTSEAQNFDCPFFGVSQETIFVS